VLAALRRRADTVTARTFLADTRRIERGVDIGCRAAANHTSRPKSKYSTCRSARGSQDGGCVPIGNDVNVAGVVGAKNPRLTVPTWNRDLRH
jgi:hypothetical protein